MDLTLNKCRDNKDTDGNQAQHLIRNVSQQVSKYPVSSVKKLPHFLLLYFFFNFLLQVKMSVNINTHQSLNLTSLCHAQRHVMNVQLLDF